jgi:hypothetical protein
MGQNKNFIAARLPQELYDRLETQAGDKKGEKTQIIIRAIAAYLEFPLKSIDTAADNNDRFVVLENRIAELEQQFQEFKELVINAENNNNQPQPQQVIPDKIAVATTNNFDILPDLWLDTLVSASKPKLDELDNKQAPNCAKSDRAVLLLTPAQPDSINQSDNTDNEAKEVKPHQAKLFDTPEGNIGPYSETKMAKELGMDRNKLRKHSKQIEEGKIDRGTPIETEWKGRLYQVSYLGNNPQRRKLWMARPVEPDF